MSQSTKKFQNSRFVRVDVSEYPLIGLPKESWPDKKLCLRYIPNDATGEDMFFVEEVRELVGVFYSNADDLCMSQPSNPEHTSLYTKMELATLLEVLDIDKSRVTLIPDVHFQCTLKDYLKGDEDSVYFLNQKKEKVMSPFQAIYAIFDAIVCGFVWDGRDHCNVHQNCLEQYESRVLEIIRGYANMDQNVLVSKKTVDSDIETFKTSCAYALLEDKRRTLNVWNEFYKFKGFISDFVPQDFYQKVTQRYGLIKIEFLVRHQSARHVKKAVAKAFCQASWIDQFGFECGLRKVIRESLKYGMPMDLWETMESIMGKCFAGFREKSFQVDIPECLAIGFHPMETPNEPTNLDAYEKMKRKTELRNQINALKKEDKRKLRDAPKMPPVPKPTMPKKTASKTKHASKGPTLKPSTSSSTASEPLTLDSGKPEETSEELNSFQFQKTSKTLCSDSGDEQHLKLIENPVSTSSEKIVNSSYESSKHQDSRPVSKRDSDTLTSSDLYSSQNSVGLISETSEGVAKLPSQTHKSSKIENSTQMDSDFISCEKCTKTSEELRTAQEYLKIAQTQLEDYKQKALRTEVVEERMIGMGKTIQEKDITLCALKKEIEKMRKTQNWDHKSKKKEIEFGSLKKKLSKAEQDLKDLENPKTQIENLKAELEKQRKTLEKAENMLDERNEKISILEEKFRENLQVGQDIQRILSRKSENEELSTLRSELLEKSESEMDLKNLNAELEAEIFKQNQNIEDLKTSRISLDEHQYLLAKQMEENLELKTENERIQKLRESDDEIWMKNRNERMVMKQRILDLEQENQKIRDEKISENLIERLQGQLAHLELTNQQQESTIFILSELVTKLRSTPARPTVGVTVPLSINTMSPGTPMFSTSTTEISLSSGSSKFHSNN